MLPVGVAEAPAAARLAGRLTALLNRYGQTPPVQCSSQGLHTQ